MDDSEIRVSVVKYPDRKNLVLRYIDPVTGRQSSRSSGSPNRRLAERAAAKWEAELREGRYRRPSKTTWDEFREKYEAECLPAMAAGTFEKVQALFNHVERILDPRLLRDLTAARISQLQSEMRKTQAEDTIKSNMAHLQAALRWAERMDLIPHAPRIEKPVRAKGSKVMKGRPITEDEFARMLSKTPEVIGESAPEWAIFLRGLWLSGLRLSEAMNLSWDDDLYLRVDLSGKYPLLRIPAEMEKGNQDRLLPIVPDFAEFLLATPGDQRHGLVFKPRARFEDRMLTVNWTSRIISAIGRAANVKVNTDPRTKKVKYASAHDLRRSFGERWALKVMPHVLKELMRHSTIETTMKYYVGRNAQTIARSLWESGQD